MNRLPTEFLIDIARTFVGLDYALPLDLAAELMDRGYMVEDLESQWSAETLIS